MPQTLREEINDVVTRYLELNLQTSASVDVAAMAVKSHKAWLIW